MNCQQFSFLVVYALALKVYFDHISLIIAASHMIQRHLSRSTAGLRFYFFWPDCKFAGPWLCSQDTSPHVAITQSWRLHLGKRSAELDFDIPTTSTIFTDNQAAISISHHPEFHSRTKHIDIAHHFLRDLIAEGTLNTVYVNTRENLADLFTKGLPRELHEDLTYRIGSLSG